MNVYVVKHTFLLPIAYELQKADSDEIRDWWCRAKEEQELQTLGLPTLFTSSPLAH